MRRTHDLRPALLMYRCRPPPSEYRPGSLRALTRVADSAIKLPYATKSSHICYHTWDGILGDACGTDGTPVSVAQLRLQGYYGTIRDSVGKVTGGAGGTRTPDFLRAREALSQLSYSPTESGGQPLLREGRCKRKRGRYLPDPFGLNRWTVEGTRNFCFAPMERRLSAGFHRVRPLRLRGAPP